MGTHFQITLVNPNYDINLIDLQQDIEIELRGINLVFSTYIEDSYINQINNADVGSSIEVPSMMIEVLEASKKIAKNSDNAFDPTVAKLVTLWDFGPVDQSLEKTQQLPKQQEINAALVSTGLVHLEVNKSRSIVTKTKPLQLDFSAIAKGYGVDAVANILKQRRIENFMVDIGGEVYTYGLNPEKENWRIAIQKPSSSLHREVYKVVSLSGKGLATSGSYYNFIEIEGVKYSHTIDPNTGWPIKHNTVSVTVIHDSVMMADAWATALNVLGSAKGLRVAEKHGLAVFFIDTDSSGYLHAIASQAFTNLNNIQ